MADENLFAAVRFNCIGEVDEKIKNLLKEHKAKEEKLLSGSATHAIVTDFGNMEAEEARDLWQIPTVTTSWVELSVKCQQLLPTKAFRPSNNLLFSPVVVCPSQLSRSDCCRLWALVTFNGGVVQLRLNNKTTHLVVPTPAGKKYEVAQTHSSVTCVTPDWILNSVKDDKLKDATKYHPSLVIVPPKTPAVSSTQLPLSTVDSTSRGIATPTITQPRKPIPASTGGAPTQHPNVSSTEIESNDIPPLNVRNIQQSMISATQLSHQQPLATNMNKEPTAVGKLPEDGDSTQSSDSTSLLPSHPDPKLQPGKQPAKKTQTKKRRTSKAKASSAQITQAIASPAVMSPMKPAQHMGTPQQQGNYITQQQQQQFNIQPQQGAPPANQMKMMNLSNTGFSPNYPMGMDTMATGMHGRPRGYTHPQMVQMNQQLQQQIQMQQMHRGTSNSMNQFTNPQQQQIMTQQMMNQQHLQQQQMNLNPRQPGQMFMQQQLPKGSGMMSPQQQNPAIVSSPQQFMTQQQPPINKPPHHAMMMQRMMSANKMPHQQNSTHQIPTCASPFQQSPSGGGMEAISPKALQQGLLIAQQNQRQQQQPLIHPSLQTPQEIPGSPGGPKKRAKPRKTKDGGEAKPRSRGKNTKKTNISNQATLPLQPDANPLHPVTFPSPYNVPQPTQHIVKNVPQPHAAVTMDEMPHIKQQPPQAQMVDDIKPVPMSTGHAPVQISASIMEEAPLPPLREPLENPLTAVPESYAGNYHGHDPSENVPRDLCLLGCVFVIAEYEKIVDDVESVATWAKSISKYGGIVESDYNSATCTHLMCATQTIPLFRRALLDGKRCVTLYWLNDILLIRELRPPWLIMHIPTPFDQTTERPLLGKAVTYTGFHQKEREQLKRMLNTTGAKVTGDLTRNHAVLICKHLISLKSDKAQEWNVPCVTIDWLKDVMEGEDADVTDDKYKNFTQSQTKLFSLNEENMKQILDPWKVPVRVTLDCMQRAHVKRKSTSMPTTLPQSKRAKVEESYQQLPRVCFTALPQDQVKDLTMKLESLGGQVCDNIRYATHLVTRNIIRTEKFFSAIASCHYIVTPEWIEDCAKSKWLLDEGKYILHDKIGEKKFNFSLQESLKRAREQPLFQNYVFCITANVRPSRELLKSIVESAKGKVIKVTPSVKELKRIQRRSDFNNKILIISCPRDEAQVVEWKQDGIPCHNAELILTGMLKQSIDEVSFQL